MTCWITSSSVLRNLDVKVEQQAAMRKARTQIKTPRRKRHSFAVKPRYPQIHWEAVHQRSDGPVRRPRRHKAQGSIRALHKGKLVWILRNHVKAVDVARGRARAMKWLFGRKRPSEER